MLKVPFKQAETLVFEKALRSAIQEIFEEDPDAYQDDFALIANLRLMVLQPQVHDNYTSTMLAYYAQLQYLESKFNISEEGVNLFFTWSNAFGKQDSVSSHNLGFEKASVLFNLAAIYSHLGVDCGISSEEAMKKAATYFQVQGCLKIAICGYFPNYIGSIAWLGYPRISQYAIERFE